MDTGKIIETLNEIKSKVDAFDRDALFSKTSTISSVLDRSYGKNSAHQKDFNHIRRSLSMLVDGKADTTSFGPNFTEIKTLTHSLLDNLIVEIGAFGLPYINADQSKGIIFNTHINQSQKQSQKIEVNIILSSLKNHLTGQQFNEILEIAQKEPDPLKAKTSILEKLKSFGADVCSNIVANLLTTPDVWTGLLG